MDKARITQEPDKVKIASKIPNPVSNQSGTKQSNRNQLKKKKKLP